jgi:3-hydroxyacyl-CoA dehydrogenase
MKTTQTIGVVGAGIMGTGIAQACAVAGFPVVMLDVDDAVSRAAAKRSRTASSVT